MVPAVPSTRGAESVNGDVRATEGVVVPVTVMFAPADTEVTGVGMLMVRVNPVVPTVMPPVPAVYTGTSIVRASPVVPTVTPPEPAVYSGTSTVRVSPIYSS